LGFEINAGQTDPRVSFLARGSGFTLFLTPEGATLRLLRSRPSPAAVIQLTLAGANPAPRVQGMDELPGRSNYFLGRNPAKWRTGISRYGAVKYGGVYPGVDLVFYGNEGRLEYDFLARPGADLSRIRFHFDGADAERVDQNGELILRVANAEVRQSRPMVYQDWGDGRHFLSGRYVRRAPREVGFDVVGYRPDRTLVIDPVLAYSSFLGGSGPDVGHVVAVDGGDNVYVTGGTVSANFPTTSPLQSANAGLFDAFVTKLDPTGKVVFSTYLGGSGNENDFRSGVESSGIAVDPAGNVYLAGRTSSIDFPVVSAMLPSYGGGDYDAFVAKLSGDGKALLYSTYLGGEANDSANGIAVDSGGAVYVTGGTRSLNDFPITAGAFQSSSNGQLEAFVTKIDPAQAGAASLVYSTYLGGLGIDRGTAIATDAAGTAYVAGRTESPDFPTRNPYQAFYGGAADAFVTVVNATGSDLIYSTFLGGTGLDVANAIALDTAGNVYLAGETASPNFPIVNGFQTAIGGSSDAFVAELDPTGTMLIYATYLGGGGLDRATGIALDAAGIVSVTGETASPSFPAVNAFQTALGGVKDAFVARLDLSQQGAASLLYSTFLGGSGDDVAYGVAVNSAGDAWVVGQTASVADFPTPNGTQVVYGGGSSDAFIARVSSATAAPDYGVSASPASLTVTPGGTASYVVTVGPVGSFTGTVDLSLSGVPANAMASFSPPSVVVVDATPQTAILTVNTTGSTPLGTFPLTITAASGTLAHIVSVTLTVASGTGTADLSVTKTSTPNPVEVRANLTYNLTVTNLGPAVATGVQVVDTLPAVAFVSASATQGTCSGTGTITCNIGALDVGRRVAVTIVVKPQAIGSVSNVATVSGNEFDPNPANNSATAVTAVESSCSAPGPCMLDPNLSVNTVVSGLTEPTGIAFLGPDDFLVLEKSTGMVKHVAGGVVQAIVLDLAVNSASERGLLGIALHPDFNSNGFVYLYWTCRGQAAAADCDSLYGDDTSDLAQAPLLGNRVDRFIWDGATLTLDQNVIRLHAYQLDADASGNFNQPPRGNHNGGKILFGPDGKLYILIGDNGRRGNLQNIVDGVLPNGQDDQFGGPQPDNAHFTGVIMRLNDDGTAPPDNPFFDQGGPVGGEAGANVQRIFAYGVRNSFGLAFDPFSPTPSLWNEENGDDSFDEINLVMPGANNGWVQIMGPVQRIADYKAIETSPQHFGLQQVRWPPTLIADTPDEAMARLQSTMLSGAFYNDPRFSWKYAVAPAPIGFVNGPGLGAQYQGDLIVGAARTFLAGGYLFDFKLTADRSNLDLSADPRLVDGVADNLDKFDLTESESLLIGRDFGITTDIQTSPRGTLYVVSLSNGAVYEILAPAPSE